MKENNLKISQDKRTIEPMLVQSRIAQLEVHTTGIVTLLKGNEADTSKMAAVRKTVNVTGYDVITVSPLVLGSYIAFTSNADITDANLEWGRR